jgi:hypothetical protein
MPTAAAVDPRHINLGVPNPSVLDRAAAGLHRFASAFPGVTPTYLHPEFAAAASPTGYPPAAAAPYVDPSSYQQPFYPHGVPPMQSPAVTPTAAPSSSSRPLGNPTPEPAAAAFTFDHPAVDPNAMPFDPYANPAYYPSMHATYHPMQYYPPHQYYNGVPMHHINPQLNPYAQSFTPASAPLASAPAPMAPAPAATAPFDGSAPGVTPGASPLFPDASLPGEHRKTPRTDYEITQGNIRLHRSQRGQPGSKEYIHNHTTITKSDVIKPCLDYVDIDALADPTKFNPKLASNLSDLASAITTMVTHVKQYDLLSPIMVPVDINLATTTVSDEKYNLLTDHPRFDHDQIALWTVSSSLIQPTVLIQIQIIFSKTIL